MKGKGEINLGAQAEFLAKDISFPPGKPEISQLCPEIGAQKNIAGLHVAMDDRRIAMEMEKGESFGDVEDDSKPAVPINEGARRTEQSFLETSVAHILVHEEGVGSPVAVSEEGDDERRVR